MPNPIINRRVLMNPPRGGSAPSYVRTAFVSSAGDDGTAALNDDTLPYLTQDAAVAALAAAYAGQPTILCYKTNTPTDLSLSADLNTLLTAGLTMQSNDANVRTLSGSISFGSEALALLTLSNIVISGSLIKSPHSIASGESAGSITGYIYTVIAAMTLSGSDGGAGSNGSAGGTVTGASGSTGADGDPPFAGGNGESVNAGGSDGSAGENGGYAWDVTLLGSGTLSSVIGIGGNGGSGGSGGNGGVATGGMGGRGGNSTAASEMQDGGAGGSGGDAIASGGNAGGGGNGGNGSTITKAEGWTITAHTLTHGTGAAGSIAVGDAGSAAPGSGGEGGAGANGGNTGASGGNGTTTVNPGNAGSNGADGVDGSIV